MPAPVAAAAPAVAADRKRPRTCKMCGDHKYTTHSCGKQYCTRYWKACPRCHGTDAHNRVSSRDWPRDRAGHRRAAKKGWARKKRASRAASTLARYRRRGRRR